MSRSSRTSSSTTPPRTSSSPPGAAQRLLRHASGHPQKHVRVQGLRHPPQDILLRAWAKAEHVALADQRTELVEAAYAAEANILYAQLAEQHRPLVSAKQEEKFKEAYLQGLRHLLSQRPRQRRVSDEEDEE